MSQLSSDQEALRATIKKNALIWGILAGLIIAAIAYWLLGGQTDLIRKGGAAVGGVLIGGLAFAKSKSSGASGAKCAECNAAFSISRSDRAETLVSSEDKEERKQLENGDTEVTTWVRETFDVVETFTCSKCGDITEKTFQSNRKRDEETKTSAPISANKGKKGASGNAKNGPVKSSGKSSGQASQKKG